MWAPDTLRAVLGDEEAELFARHFGVSAIGNFEHGTSVLHVTRTAEDPATIARLEASRAKLLAARAQRPRPHLDDKVITAWNGLMIAALANAARALRDPVLAERATRAAEFVWTALRGADGSLLRRWRDGEAASAGQPDDHAYLAHGCLPARDPRPCLDPIAPRRSPT